MSEVTIAVSGQVGCAKSALLGEIEIMLKAMGVPVRYADEKAAQAEKNGTHADLTDAIEMYKPSVVLIELAAPVPAAPADKGELPPLPVFAYFKQVHEGWQEFNKANEFSDGEGGGEALVKMSDILARQAAIAQPGANLWPCGDCGKSVKEACGNRPCGYRAMQQQANAASPQPSGAVLDGWKPMPEIATAPMLTALWNRLWAAKAPAELDEAYRAMLAAAPQPPASPPPIARKEDNHG